jgi:site-specific recombinase XerD
VAERMLHTETEIIRQCADRCIHIHARVGYEEGPQVPDPHMRWHEMRHSRASLMLAKGVDARTIMDTPVTPKSARR